MVNWPQVENKKLDIKKLDIKTRKLLTIYKMLENVPAEKGGGGGLMELNQVHRATTGGLAEYVKSSTDYRIQFVHKHEHNKAEKVSLTHLAKNFQKQV